MLLVPLDKNPREHCPSFQLRLIVRHCRSFRRHVSREIEAKEGRRDDRCEARNVRTATLGRKFIYNSRFLECPILFRHVEECPRVLRRFYSGRSRREKNKPDVNNYCRTGRIELQGGTRRGRGARGGYDGRRSARRHTQGRSSLNENKNSPALQY